MDLPVRKDCIHNCVCKYEHDCSCPMECWFFEPYSNEDKVITKCFCCSHKKLLLKK